MTSSYLSYQLLARHHQLLYIHIYVHLCVNHQQVSHPLLFSHFTHVLHSYNLVSYITAHLPHADYSRRYIRSAYDCVHAQHVSPLFCCHDLSLSLYTIAVMCNRRVRVLLLLLLLLLSSIVSVLSYHAVGVYTLMNVYS